MPNIKITLTAPHPSFTKMRVYRATSPTNAFNESYFIEEVAAAAEYIDRSNNRSPTAERYYYGFRYSTASGFTWDAAPVSVQNRYDLDYLNCEALDHPFLSGNSAIGIYHLTNLSDVVPDRSLVQNLIKAKFSTVGFANLTADSGNKNAIVSIGGRLIIAGIGYGTISTPNIATAASSLNTLRAGLVDVVPDSSFVLTKNGFKWRLCMLSPAELAMTGRYSIASYQSGSYPMNALSNYSNWMALTYNLTAGYVTWCGSSINSVNGNWNTQTLNTSTGFPGATPPAVTMEFIGRE